MEKDSVSSRPNVVDVAECRPAVRAFAIEMEKRLRENDHKGGWYKIAPWAHVIKASENVIFATHELGLLDAGEGDRNDFLLFSADAANRMMMACDVRRCLGPNIHGE